MSSGSRRVSFATRSSVRSRPRPSIARLSSVTLVASRRTSRTSRTSRPSVDVSGLSELVQLESVEGLWEVFDALGRDEDWTLNGCVNPRKVYENVLVNRYKDRACDGPVLFAAVEYCADILCDSKTNGWRRTPRKLQDVPRILQAVLNAKADVNAEATHAKGSMRVIHYAAGLGAVPVLKVLLEAHMKAAGDTSPELARSVALNMKTRNEKGQEHYAPLHDAVWFGQLEAVEWLLQQRADANSQNLMGWTPLHVVAKVGNEESLDELVDVLMHYGADLGIPAQNEQLPLSLAVSGPLFPASKFHLLASSCHDRKSTFLMYLQDVYNLALENEQAAEEFVEVLLGKHISERARNDDQRASGTDLDGASSSDAEGARQLRFVQSVDTASARTGQESAHALRWMAEIMEKAPRAAAMILDVLVGMPMIECQEHHPLPRRANMELDGCEEPMVCDYQPDSLEKDDDSEHEFSWKQRIQKTRALIVPRSASQDVTQASEEALSRPKCRLPSWSFDTEKLKPPAWHERLAPMAKNRNDDKEVAVQVLKMPDLLDVRVIHVLATTGRLNLFAEKTVQGIVNCLWHRLVKYGVKMAIYMKVFMLVSLLAWIAIAELDPHGRVPLRRSFWLVMLATASKELLNLGYSLCLCRVLQRPMASYLLSSEVVVDLFATCLLFALAWVSRDSFAVPRVGSGRSVLALNTLIRWFQITYMCRPFSTLGKKIVCVLKSFLPMKEMMFITAVVFFGFAVAAVLIKDDVNNDCGQDCAGPVLMNLFKALLMGDGDGFDELTKLPGADPEGVFAAMLVLVATILFSVSVLNLLIAVYSNEYDRKEKQSDLLFFFERAGICYRHLMEPLWSTWQQWPASLWRWRERCCKRARRQEHSNEVFVKWLVGVTTLALAALAVLLAELLHMLLLPLVLVVAAMLLLQVAAMRCDWEHPHRTEGGSHFYLWICCRTNFNKSDFAEVTVEDLGRSLLEIHATVQKMSRSLERQMADVKRQVQTLSSHMAQHAAAQEASPQKMPFESAQSQELLQLQRGVSNKQQQCKELISRRFSDGAYN